MNVEGKNLAAEVAEPDDDESDVTGERPAFAPLMSSRRMDWETPDELLELVGMVGAISLDPCTTFENPTRARAFICPSTPDESPHVVAGGGQGERGNGLETPWDVNGLVFVNPPYGRELPRWTAKIRMEAASGAEIIALVPARTDTKWWHRHLSKADAICFWAGRLKFRGAEYGAPFPSAIVYFGDRAKAFRRVFTGQGWIVP